MNLYQEIKEAHDRIKGKVLHTPLFHSSYLSALNEGKVFLKLESEQYTGSFKARGALNKVLKTCENTLKPPCFITASTGNHARGVARAVALTNTRGKAFLPINADSAKIKALKNDDISIEFYGKNPITTELYAKKKAKEEESIWISPYNDYDVIAGQGTIATEILNDIDTEIDALFGCIGGGGMMSGVACWMKELSPKTTIVGCLPKNSPEMYLSIQNDEVTFLKEYTPTLSDGSAGGLEKDAITFDLCRKWIDEFYLVDEEAIQFGIKYMINTHHKVIEGAASVALSAFIKNIDHYKNKCVVIIICGSNISVEVLKKLL